MINKVIYGGKVLIDLTADTIQATKLLEGFTAHDASGALINGACTFDSDTSDATVTVAELLEGRTAYARGAKMTGSMPNRGKQTGSIAAKDDSVQILQGYHDGSGSVGISSVEKAKIIAGNIKSGVSILGVVGDYGGEDVKAQAKEVNSATTDQVVLPDSIYDYLSQVTVKAIPYTETDNPAGGKTVTIG